MYSPLARLPAHRGFTLIELLIIVALLSLLVGFTIVKFKPFSRLMQAYDLRRISDVRQLERALTHAMIDGRIPPINIPERREEAKWICQYTYRGLQCLDPPIAGVDLSYLVPVYIPAIPEDPLSSTGGITGYRIYKDGSFFIIEAAFQGQGQQQ